MSLLGSQIWKCIYTRTDSCCLTLGMHRLLGWYPELNFLLPLTSKWLSKVLKMKCKEVTWSHEVGNQFIWRNGSFRKEIFTFNWSVFEYTRQAIDYTLIRQLCFLIAAYILNNFEPLLFSQVFENPVLTTFLTYFWALTR